MNKSLLVFSILASMTVYASNNYVVIVDKENNDYESELKENNYIEYSEWEIVSNDCVSDTDWVSEEIYTGINFNKTTTCLETKERDKNIYVYDQDNNLVLDITEVETESKTTITTESLTGTFIANSCKQVLDSNGSIGDGTYILNVNGNNFNAYCDMGNGGWTLAMRLKNTGQLSGSNRDNFWQVGANLSPTYAMTELTGFDNTEMGFLGWDRIEGMLSSSDLQMKIVGVNSLNRSVNESYVLEGFSPDMSNTTLESGILSGGGVYTVSKYGDIDTKSNWGTCGSNVMNDAHVGLGLCPKGLDGIAPEGREVQLWHYGTYYSDYGYNMNVSFDTKDNKGSTHNYNKIVSYDMSMYIK